MRTTVPKVPRVGPLMRFLLSDACTLHYITPPTYSTYSTVSFVSLYMYTYTFPSPTSISGQFSFNINININTLGEYFVSRSMQGFTPHFTHNIQSSGLDRGRAHNTPLKKKNCSLKSCFRVSSFDLHYRTRRARYICIRI